MDLTTFRLRIQATTGLAAAQAGHYEQGLVDGWVNEAVVQFLMRTKAVKETATLTLTIGTGDYTMDPAILAIEDLTIGSKMLSPTDTQDIRRWRLNAGTSVDGDPGSYAYEGQTLMLYPTPSAAGQLKMIYVPRPSPMTAAGHDPSVAPYGRVPSEYHPVIEAYAKWKAAEYANDQPSQNGQSFKQEYESGVNGVKAIETRKAGVATRRARPGWRSQQNVGVSPGADL